MLVKFSNTVDWSKEAIVVGVVANCEDWPDYLKELDSKTSGLIKRALDLQNIDKFGKIIDLIAPEGVECNRIVLVGLGEEEHLDNNKLEEIGALLHSHFVKLSDQNLFLNFGNLNLGKVENYQIGPHVAYGFNMKKWKFDKYITQSNNNNFLHVSELNLFSSDVSKSETLMEELGNLEKSISTARFLVSEPPNVLYPESYAEYVVNLLPQHDVEVEVLDERAMKKLGMNTLLCVGQGSNKESRLVVMKWNGAENKDDPFYAFVGKGVCFDTGGISLKPPLNMDDMKYDMAGSAAVVGLMESVARNRVKKNVVGVIGLVENMPSGSAVKPSDIVVSMSGQTVEVLNTDAEGRLVLADALWYVQEKFNPKFVVDLATLTGAIEVCLGSEYAGLFSNDDDLALNLFKAGTRTGEKLWRMPLCKSFDKAMDSDVADVRNISNMRGAGASTAGQFLQRFIKCSWAHLDIANVAWSQKGSAKTTKGATGFGVRLLYDLLNNYK